MRPTTAPPHLAPLAPDSEDAESTLALTGAATTVQLPRVTVQVVAGPDQGATLEVGRSSRSVGTSDECDLRLQDDFVSRKHLELFPTSSGLTCIDLESLNGTFLGSTRLQRGVVTETCSLRVGRTTLLLTFGSEAFHVPLSKRTSFGHALGRSAAMRAVFAMLEPAAASDVTILLEGASGTGKDVLANSVHSMSRRANGPFVVVDCGSIPETLIESELFGHERGAFTGASQARIGAFEQAAGGTLFLDEVGELPLEMQPKLLRAVEARSFRRVGGNRVQSSDVRIVAATNRSLADAVRRGTFREDLYYRLNVLSVRVPPLSERGDDIPLLAQRFLHRATGNAEAEIPPALMRVLCSYSWPGNARELRNVIERFATFHTDDPRVLLGVGSIDPRQVASPSHASSSMLTMVEGLSYHDAKERVIEALHRELIPHVLKRCDGNISEAARALGLPRTSLHRMMKQRNAEELGEE